MRSQRYYQQIIRDYLKINPSGKQAQKIIAIAVSKATLVMEYSAAGGATRMGEKLTWQELE